MTHPALTASRQHRERELTEWATTHFPGITDLTWRNANRGARGSEAALIGSWQGITLEVSRVKPDMFRAYLVARCDVCDKYAGPRSLGIGLTSAADVATLFERGEVPTTVDCCFSCRWLLDTQQMARRCTSRFSRWRFKLTYGVTVDDMLARTP